MSSPSSVRVWFESAAIIAATVAAGAAAYQSFLLHETRGEFAKAIRLDKQIDSCAQVSARLVRFGRELDAYVSGAKNDITFAGTAAHDRQIVSVHNARLDLDEAVETFLITAPTTLGSLARKLTNGSENIVFSTNAANLIIIDEFTTAMGKRLNAFRGKCRDIALDRREVA